MDVIVRDRMDFRRITLSISGTMASTAEYELVRTQDGLEASYYDGGWNYNRLVSRSMCRKSHRKISKAGYQRLAEESFSLGVPSWNGFSGSNPHVLDGEMFSLEIVLMDDSIITAHGSNAYPDNYHEFFGLLREASIESI